MPDPAIPTDDPRLVALIRLFPRLGADTFQIRYQDDDDPVVWIVVVTHGDHHTVGAGLTPWQAAYQVAESLVDGGECQHCHRPTGVEISPDPMPLGDLICWYQYDPELSVFRRACEGA